MMKVNNMIFKNKRLTFTIITLLWVCVIFSFSLQTGETSGEMSGSLVRKLIALFRPEMQVTPAQLEMLELVLRKCAHFTEFLILGMISSIALRYWPFKRKALCSIGFCVTVAAIDEMLQLFVGGRSGRVMDVMIDSAGAVVGIVLFQEWFIKNVRKKSSGLFK